MEKRLTTIIFDLDGTLLNTLEDLADSTNHALTAFGFTPRTLQEIKRFVGNGVRKLIERALPDGENNPLFANVFACFKTYYVNHCMEKTTLYPGIETLLRQLKKEGYKTAIVSNKLQSGVDALYEHYFSNLIDIAIGEHSGRRPKPAPDMVEKALQILGCKPSEAIYVGDSDVDIATARNAGLPCLSVLWGFRDKKCLIQNGATHIVSSPEEIYRFCQQS